jgi:hypothetical protein
MPVPLETNTKNCGVKVLATTNTTPTTAIAAAAAAADDDDELDNVVRIRTELSGFDSRRNRILALPFVTVSTNHYSNVVPGSCPWVGWSELAAKGRKGTHPFVHE